MPFGHMLIFNSRTLSPATQRCFGLDVQIPCTNYRPLVKVLYHSKNWKMCHRMLWSEDVCERPADILSNNHRHHSGHHFHFTHFANQVANTRSKIKTKQKEILQKIAIADCSPQHKLHLDVSMWRAAQSSAENHVYTTEIVTIRLFAAY